MGHDTRTSGRTCHGPEETRQCAGAFAGRLEPGDVVALHGELGTGKTCFVQGVAAAIGVTEPVTSPTFTLVNEYAGRLPVYHMDLYRLSGPEEALQLGMEEYMGGNGITLIEWADRAAELIPNRAWHVRLVAGSTADERTIDIRESQPP
jgi:tRNA threonylcarbamoyladenosine biosynthesis protein TsaE